MTCPFCQSRLPEALHTEFVCPHCLQLVGKDDRGRLVQAAPDNRKPWIKPELKEGSQ